MDQFVIAYMTQASSDQIAEKAQNSNEINRVIKTSVPVGLLVLQAYNIFDFVMCKTSTIK